MAFPAWVPGALDAIGSVLGFGQASKSERRAHKLAQAQFAFQQEAAHKGVQWRVADAKAAGIHPLAALGLMPTNFAPVSMGGDGGASHLSDLGQNIGRAVGAYQSDRDRRHAIAEAAADSAVRRKREEVLFDQQVRANELDIAMAQSELARANAPGTGPGLNVGAGAVNVVPARQTSPAASNVAREAGSIRDYGYADVEGGGLAIVPSYDIHERIEDNLPQELMWAMRNNIFPMFQGLTPPSAREHPLPNGATEWRWNVWRQAFMPYDRRRDEFIINGRRYRNRFHRGE